MDKDPIAWIIQLILAGIIGWIIKWLLDGLLKICEENMRCAYGAFILGLVLGFGVMFIWGRYHNTYYRRSREEIWQTQLSL